MTTVSNMQFGPIYLAEMKEFASFSKKTQRYIRRSLDVAYKRHPDPVERWGREAHERISIRSQAHNYYLLLDRIRNAIPANTDLKDLEAFMGPLIPLATFDLTFAGLPCFNSFRFLYERLISARARPWLPAVFIAAAAQPAIKPEWRGKLLQSISEAAATAPAWSDREPVFFPEWVDKVDVSEEPLDT